MAESAGRYCPLCGQAAGLTDRFCRRCGQRLQAQAPSQQARSEAADNLESEAELREGETDRRRQTRTARQLPRRPWWRKWFRS